MRTKILGSWVGRARLLLNRSRREVPGPLPDSLLQSDPRQSIAPFDGDQRTEEIVQPSLEIVGRPAENMETVVLCQADFRRSDATESIIPVGTLDRETRSRHIFGELRLALEPSSILFDHVMFGGTIGNGDLRSRYFNPASDQPWIRVGAGDVQRLSGSAYAWLRTHPGQRWTVTIGSRWDWTHSSMTDPDDPESEEVRQDLSAMSPSVGINYELPPLGNVYFSTAGSFKAPTLEQLYDQRPYDPDGPGEIPAMSLSSAALDPQRGIHFDLGTRLRPLPGTRLEAGIYYAKSTDEIGFDLANFRYDNIEESTHSGFEGSLSYNPVHTAWAQIAYTYTRARFVGGPDDGKQINSVPQHILRGEVRIEPLSTTSLTVSASHVRDQWLDEGNEYRLPAFTVVDLAAVQELGLVSLFATARNILDEDYAPAGYLTIDQMGADLPLYFPAAERSFQIGIRVERSESQSP